MIVATMSLEEKLARVRADVARVLRKYERKVAEMQRAMKVSRNKVPTLHHAYYPSPDHIDWIVTIRCTKKRDKVFLTAWWHINGVGLEAMVLGVDSAFYFDSHFFQRYRIRESDVVGAADNLRTFLRANYDITMKRLDTERHGMREAAGVAHDGLFVGTVRSVGIIAFDTYLSNDMLRGDQQALQRELQYHAHTKDWNAARLQQYRKWLDEVARMFDDEPE
ncbi:MAG: hypothetical protein IPP33_11865 [Flavobacteriales bacterium]|nr:hypothetical protein [Flavobacteriales bacterium]